MRLFLLIFVTAAAAWAQSGLSGASAQQNGTWPAAASATLSLISISIVPANPSQVNGAVVAFSATGTFGDGSTQDVTQSSIWSTATPAVAVFGTLGTQQPALCVSIGTSLITATKGSVSGSTLLTCSGAVGENAYCTGAADSTCFAAVQTDGPAALPTSGIYTGLDGTPAPGSSVNLACGASLQTALNGLAAGQKLVIPALCNGTQNVITGSFTLPAVSGASSTQWNWIETDQTGNVNFPAQHTRVTPCSAGQASLVGYPNYQCSNPAILMPRIQCSANNASCFIAAAGANHYRIMGLEIAEVTGSTSDGNGLVDLTAGTDHIILDRDWLHGQPVTCTINGNNSYTCGSTDVKNGIQIQNATNVAVVNSWLTDIACPKGTCVDSHAFGGGNGTLASHTYKIYNNLISAAGENFLQGGAGSIGATNIITPTDFEVRANHFFKPVSYALCTYCNQAGGTVAEFKNHFEIKNGQRGLVEGNVFENIWMGWETDQAGFSVHINPFNQNSAASGTASTDGTGTLTALTGAFNTNSVSPICAVPNQCQVKYNNVKYLAQSFIDSSHITVSPAPPATATASFSQCNPGLNPNAITTDWTFRYNDFRNATNGIEFASVRSDCADENLGIYNLTAHDNLFQGINSDLNSSTSNNNYARCFFILNSQASVTIHSIQLEHNTCIVARSGSFGYSGLDASEDATDTTRDGSTGSYIASRTVRNNIGAAGGWFTYSNGSYPGGALAGLKQQSCTPPVTGTTCSWTYTENVLGTGLWTNQLLNSPFPSTNQTCNAAAATCFPSGSAFTSLFVNYNGPNGQPGYLGDYHFSPGSPFIGAATDGSNVGADIGRVLTMTAGVRGTTSYVAASVTTSNLPAASVGIVYSQQLTGTSASDMQLWRIISGSLPAGLSLTLGGLISGTPTSSGSSTFTVQMMDAAQQYATAALSLTVQ